MTEKKSRPAKAANPNENSSQTTTYPRRIHLSDTAEAYIAGLAVDLVLDRLQLHQLPPSLMELWEYGYQTGRQSRQAELDHLNWTADRLYIAMCARSPKPYIDRPSYSALERIRGNSANADRIDAANVRRFAGVTS